MRASGSTILVVVLAAATARADTVEDAARVHLDRGVAAFRAGDYARAHRELTAASELVPDKPNPYRWLALTAVQLGDCRRALVDIEAFLSRVPEDDERVPEIVRLRELCQRTGALRVASSPPRASLRIDGAIAGTTPHRAPSPVRAPITRRWWFWAAVGGAALTATAAIAYAASGDGGPTPLPPIDCDPTGCRMGMP
jgi:hypothetical protein